MGFRETLQKKPWVGWLIFGPLATAAAVVVYFQIVRTDPTDNGRLAQELTLRCEESGFEFKLDRGRMEQHLYIESNNGPLDPKKGMPNPKTGKPTCFPSDRADWEATIARINKERSDAEAKRAASSGSGGV